MRIVVVGAGKLGYSISELLSREQYEVVLIDRDATRLEEAKNRLDVLTIMANGSHPQTMQDMDVKKADVLIAVTDSLSVGWFGLGGQLHAGKESRYTPYCRPYQRPSLY